ncbi:hypothetical protein [Burkholderia stabilis]|uniref:hypothetical protein n=1 Tax=Burkholderia stabilis TaxID=95485 RepID=UPI00196A56AC|nr:hypothetical protein [Burkholderia stabilis]
MGNVEVIGISVEHRDRRWAVHVIVDLSANYAPYYAVSDVLLGRQVPGYEARTIDASRAAVIAMLDAISDKKWAETFGAGLAAQAAQAEPMPNRCRTAHRS